MSGPDPDGPCGRRARSHALTGRELEVLALMASGASNDEIARQLGLAPATVKSHLSRAYRKIGVGNRVQATRHWLQHLAPDTPERAPAAPTAPTHDADHPPDQIDQHLRALASDSPGARVLRKRRRSLRAAQNDPGADT